MGDENGGCEDAGDVADLLGGDLAGVCFMKVHLIFGDPTHNIDLRYGLREAAIAWRYSSGHGTAIRDFGVGSFAVRREFVDRLLNTERLQAGLGSPLGREALASLALAASATMTEIYESAVYAYERIVQPLGAEFLDQIRPATVRLSELAHRPNAAAAKTLR